MNIVGSKIKRFREEKGYKQECMAVELEISQSNYGLLEKDDNRLTVSKIKRIAANIKYSGICTVWGI